MHPARALACLLGLLSLTAVAGETEALAAYNAHDYARAQKEWQPLAEKGNPRAEFGLGKLYEAGQGVAQDYNAAANWMRKAANQGDADAQNTLGRYYLAGHGVTADAAQAASWFQRAAKQDNPSAENNLASLYLEGHGVAQDQTKAAQLYKQSAEQGYAIAQNNLGLLYLRGQGLPRDPKVAAGWFEKSAQQGNADGQFYAGMMYYHGTGVKQSNIDGVGWYRKAAEQGHPAAETAFAMAILKGDAGDTYTPAEAVRLLHKAAEAGNMQAQHNLAIYYANAEGDEHDVGQAYFWIQVAARNGDTQGTKLQDALRAQLPAEKLQAANAAVSVWVAAHPAGSSAQ